MAALTIPVHLRWGDMDIFKHINNVAYVGYLEDARVSLLANAGFAPDLDGFKPLVFQPEPIEMTVWIESMGNSSYVIGYSMHDGGVEYLRAKTTMVCMDLERGRPGRIPAELRATYTRLMRS
ncbi:MAG: acyl-CoA thioesterase [Actinobacteria bacterium]|nr:acyl-CoA thioesterase [Actinomycetota bacterium]